MCVGASVGGSGACPTSTANASEVGSTVGIAVGRLLGARVGKLLGARVAEHRVSSLAMPTNPSRQIQVVPSLVLTQIVLLVSQPWVPSSHACAVGMCVGASVGSEVGFIVGMWVGCALGSCVGARVGAALGFLVGMLLG
jgi:hypothetical protein